MSSEADELENMVLSFRVSELQMLLGFAGRNKSGRKNELQLRALELLRLRSHPVQLKIRELYKTIQADQLAAHQMYSQQGGDSQLDENMHQRNDDARVLRRVTQQHGGSGVASGKDLQPAHQASMPQSQVARAPPVYQPSSYQAVTSQEAKLKKQRLRHGAIPHFIDSESDEVSDTTDITDSSQSLAVSKTSPSTSNVTNPIRVFIDESGGIIQESIMTEKCLELNPSTVNVRDRLNVLIDESGEIIRQDQASRKRRLEHQAKTTNNSATLVQTSSPRNEPKARTLTESHRLKIRASHVNRTSIQNDSSLTCNRSNNSVYPPYPYPTKVLPPQMQIQQPSQYPVHPDVRLKKLPFYDMLGELLKPSSLMPQGSMRLQESTFQFHLTPQQASDVATYRDCRPGSKMEYIIQVQMRFCLQETSCEQEDYFPPSVQVKVNGKQCPLPNPIPTNKPGVEPKRPPRPVNISPLVKLSPTVANTIQVTWSADYGRRYAVAIYMVKKLTSSELLTRLKNRGARHSDYTRGLIKEKLNEDADSEIATTSLRVSLACPLGKMRMSTPCRASTCLHLQCFDASLYLQMNERKPTWNCPVCDKTALYDNLVIDGYFQEVLLSKKLLCDVNEIQLLQDGSWENLVLKKEKDKDKDKGEVKAESNSRAKVDVDTVDLDESTAAVASKPEEKKNAPVIDLISDSEDDDDEGPAAKQMKLSNNKNPSSQSTSRRNHDNARRDSESPDLLVINLE